MGGDDSQKLLPWRGMYSSPGRKPPAQQQNQHCNGKLRWGGPGHHFAQQPRRHSATDCLGHFRKADLGHFSQAPKPELPCCWSCAELPV